jgi:hypothetical protein
MLMEEGFGWYSCSIFFNIVDRTFIGSGYSGGGISGSVDDVMIFNRSLNAKKY